MSTSDSSTVTRHTSLIGYWLLTIAAMIALMVVVGGLTRLTGSGLSITEWRPVTGMIPPLSDADWVAEFAKYQGSPQYELLNQGMGLAAFKSIYWWEWTHRFLGRLIGVVLIVPFLYFAIRRWVDRRLLFRFLTLLLLGGAQGALGWWMVKSGLAPAHTAVSQYRLAAHLGLAIILFAYTLWIAFEYLGVRRSSVASLARYKWLALVLVAVVFVQMLLGAFMAGLDAGLAFSDWPTYGGAWIPPGLYDLQPWWINHFENHALVHFQHRTMGYLVAVLALITFVQLRRAGADRPVRIAGIHVVIINFVQIVLGIFTVLNMVPIPLAAAHQIMALALFGSALWLLYVLPDPETSRVAASA